MKEKVIIKSKVDEKKRNILGGIAAVCVALCIIFFIGTFSFCDSEENLGYYGRLYEPYELPTFYIAIAFTVIGIISSILFASMLQNSLIVSNIKISGRMKFGKIVDLPVDVISATSISSLFSKISISTSSGFCSFFLIENYKEIHQAINDLIIERRNTKSQDNKSNEQNNISHADELKKYKALLDSGIITQEEFNAKKKQILGL